MVFLIVVVLLAAVVAVLSAPLRARRQSAPRDAMAEADVAALEAAKEAKYREIRDAELDYRTGKLSEEDWRALDEQLRGEAVEILQRLDRAR